ncbi:MAG: aminoacyl-tRNA hydrolase [Spirochaetales bacterium]|uniref:Peptidyl-tRNA hydrolase n=1 Tax=Candidatus Thalassospirochaeta sargassi TaxID=3119039 RepID=A0AAJ1IIY2_9SPIO|nr:aminoacyl-tRNA hydrolase [Spirochaetales bacterium]
MKHPLKPNRLKNKNLILIGLGNPGDKYRETRHNAGFAVIDYLSEKFEAPLNKAFLRPVSYGSFAFSEYNVYLVKPLTFMNRSGDVLPYILRKTACSADDVVLVCDNMDLVPGMIRLKKKGSSAGHNGIKSVIESLQTDKFKRMYIGVGRSKTGESVVDHVLGCFNESDRQEFNKAVKAAADALIGLTVKDENLVMNEINKKQD